MDSKQAAYDTAIAKEALHKELATITPP